MLKKVTLVQKTRWSRNVISISLYVPWDNEIIIHDITPSTRDAHDRLIIHKRFLQDLFSSFRIDYLTFMYILAFIRSPPSLVGLL